MKTEFPGSCAERSAVLFDGPFDARFDGSSDVPCMVEGGLSVGWVKPCVPTMC